MNVLRRSSAVTLVVLGSIAASLTGCGMVSGAHGFDHGGGQMVVSYAGFAGPVLLSSDRRTVTVAGFTYPCFGSLTPIARETRTRVGLWLKYVTPAHHGACNSAMAMEGPRKIRLGSPLGSRRIVDGATGKSLRWFDIRRLLRPAFVPAGYTLQDVTPLVRDSLPAPATPGCRQDYRSPGATLSITQSAGPLELPQAGGRAPTPIKVRGYRGLASAYAITWREAGYNVMIQAYSDANSSPALAIGTLIAIADSAPGGSG